MTPNVSGDTGALPADTPRVPHRPDQPLSPAAAAIRAAIAASLQDAAAHGPATVSLAPTGPPPTLRDVTPADLTDVGRLLALWAQAQQRGWLSSSAADRLNVVAAAVHARRMGHEPCRLFVALLRDRRWEVITQEDEDTAQRWLRDALYGPALRTAPEAAAPPAAPAVPLSADARYVDAVPCVLPPAWRDQPFLAVKLQDPTWTRARWEQAQAELTQWRLQQAQANARGPLARLGAILAIEEPWEDAGDVGDVGDAE